MGRLCVRPSNLQWLSRILIGLFPMAWYKGSNSYHLGKTTVDLVEARSPSELLLSFFGVVMSIYKTLMRIGLLTVANYHNHKFCSKNWAWKFILQQQSRRPLCRLDFPRLTLGSRCSRGRALFSLLPSERNLDRSQVRCGNWAYNDPDLLCSRRLGPSRNAPFSECCVAWQPPMTAD